jgi:hypothetical protein
MIRYHRMLGDPTLWRTRVPPHPFNPFPFRQSQLRCLGA